PPTRFSLLLKPPVTPFTVPPLLLVIVQVLALLLPVNVSAPPLPLIEPLRVPPLSVKESVVEPPARFSTLLNPPATPVTVPALALVMLQVFATLSSVSVSVPPVPLIEPLSVPSLCAK